MNTSRLSRRIAVVSAFALLGGCAMMENMTGGSTTRLGASMSAAQEVPVNTSTGTGNVTATLDRNTNKLSYEVTYSGLTGPATAGHFHGPAGPGQNAGVVLPFPNPASPIRGEATLTAAQAADLLAGRWYANIHTARFPGGEIRGQVVAR
jgi:hypothetical protein